MHSFVFSSLENRRRQIDASLLLFFVRHGSGDPVPKPAFLLPKADGSEIPHAGFALFLLFAFMYNETDNFQ